ncbi:MAG: metallophosphoesterase [Candidatus Pacearchaeota archaeon]
MKFGQKFKREISKFLVPFMLYTTVQSTMPGQTQEQSSYKTTLEKIVGDENVVRLYPKGKPCYVISDKHDGYKNYEKIEKKEDLINKVKNGEVYVVDLGDVVHPERISEHGQESKFLDREIARKDTLEKLGKERYYTCLKGNHDYEAEKSYEKRKAVNGCNIGILNLFYRWLKKFGPGKALANAWHEIRFPSRGFTENQYAYLKSLPIAVIIDDSIVLTHGGYPSREQYSNRNKAIYDILWNRSGDAAEFLDDIGAKLLINGHTAPNQAAWMYNLLLALQGRAKWDTRRRIATIYNKNKNPTRVFIGPSKPETWGSWRGMFGGGGGSYLKLDSEYNPDKWKPGKQIQYLD